MKQNSRQLPSKIQELADRGYELLKIDPQYPSLHFKKVGEFWSVRVGLHYRAVAVEQDGDLVWFGFGLDPMQNTTSFWRRSK